MEDWLIPLFGIIALFIVLPGMVFHYITLWRREKVLQPDDERMMEDLWRSAKAMERRIDTLERLLDMDERDEPRAPRRARPSYDEKD